MSPDLTILLARLDSFENKIESKIETVRQEGSERGRDLWRELNKQAITMTSLDGRMKSVEKHVESAGPTLKEWSDMKAKATGAGMLGRFVWRAAPYVVAGAVGLAAFGDRIKEVANWLMGK